MTIYFQSNVVVGADTSGLEAGMQRAGRAVEAFSSTVEQVVRRAEAELSGVGRGGDVAAKAMAQATRGMEGEIQKQIAAMQAGSTESRAYWEALAGQKGIGKGALQPLLDELDAVSVKAAAATESAQSLEKVRSMIGNVAGSVAQSLGAELSLQRFIEESVQAERQQTQLAAMLKATGEAAGWSRDQLNEMAGALSGSSSYSSGEINEAQTRLLAYTGIVGKAVPETMQAVVDLAAGTGRTVAQSADLLGEAINSPSKGMESLSKIGIQFGQDQIELAKKLESSGQLYEAQQIVLGKLESSYGGAAQAARNTFGGALSALGSTMSSLMTGDAQGLEGMRQSVESLTQALGSQETRQAFGTFTSGLALIIETATKVAAGVVNTLGQIGSKIGLGIAQMLHGSDDPVEQANKRIAELKAEVTGLDKELGRDRKFNAGDGYDSIDDLKERAKAARAEMNALVSARDDLVRGAGAGKSRPEAPAPAPAPAPAAQFNAGGSAAQQQVDTAARTEATRNYEAQIKSIQEKIAIQDLEIQSNGKLTESDRLRAKINRELSGARQASALLAVDELAAGERALAAKNLEAKANAELIADRQRSIAGIEEQIKSENRAAEAIGLTGRALVDLEIKRLDADATAMQTLATDAQSAKKSAELVELYLKEASALRTLADAKRGAADKKEAVEKAKAPDEATKKIAEDWERHTNNINSTLTDALMRGFENGKGFAKELRDTVVNMFKTMVLKPVISAALSPVSTALAGMLPTGATAGAGGGTASKLISYAGSISGLTGGSLSMGLNAGVSALFGEAGIMGGLDAGMTALGMGNIAGGLGTLAGVMGPIAIGLIALTSVMGKFKGEKRFGGQYGYSATDDQIYDANRDVYIDAKAGNVAFLAGPSGGEIGRAEVTKAIQGTIEGINGMLSGAGSALSITGFQAGLETSGKGRGGVFAGGTLTGGVTFGESGIGNNYAGTMFEKTSTQSPDAETAIKNFTSDMLQVTVQALQAATDLPKTIADRLKGVDAEALTDEAATALLTTIQTQIAAVAQLRTAIDGLPFQKLGEMSFDGIDTLIQKLGGLDNAAAAMSSYYENYYSEAEKAANFTRVLTEEFAALGFELPSSRDALRALMDANIALGDAGAPTVAALLGLQGAFAQLVPAVTDTAAAIVRSAADIANERAGLERQILQLQNDTAGLRALDLSKLDESNQDLLKTIWALQDQQAAAAEAARAASAAAAEQRAWADAQAQAAQRVREAWKSVGDSLIDEIKRIRGEVLDTGALGSAYLQSQFVLATVQARAGDEKAASSLPQLSQALLALAKDNASSAIGFKQMQLQIAASLEETLRFVAQKGGFAVPAFASGGTHQGGWAMVGENGAELAYMPPARIYTAGQTAGILDDSAMLEEMRQLRADNRAQAGEIARLHLRVAKVLEKWEGDGMPSQREEVQA